MEASIHNVAKIEYWRKDYDNGIGGDFVVFEAFDIKGNSIGEVTFYGSYKTGKIKITKGDL